ncbi:hypothetical protein HYH03_011042 [Edaphochlamys debaryana]|uniref:SHSP domain-containing protein n=1 Tax=Edaphochlamys debaryana TaxID=47281 RepID=A0A835XUW3_9CHLO|nr:hypothetical protein HYH03_011042 [Edaphochlamys debaryana]|eukprot:KAG2490653.1 hypothetical protein HYH03_011042 [Edaphochlamys debaryana]
MALTMQTQRAVAASRKTGGAHQSGMPRCVAIARTRGLSVRPHAFFLGPIARTSCRPPAYYRSPLSELMGLGLVDEMMAEASQWLRESSLNASHPVNIQTFEDRYEVASDCPGMADEDVTVEVSPDRVLTIAGSRKTAAKPAPKPKPAADEEPTGAAATASAPSHIEAAPEAPTEAEAPGPSFSVSYRFQRSFGLPEDADVEGVEASLERGVLSVRIPRKQAERPQPRRVSIKGPGAEKALE